MKCIVCDRDGITNEMNECPDCAFPLIKRAGIGGQDEYETLMQKKAEEYAQEILETLKVGLKVYTYQKNGDEIELDEIREKVLKHRGEPIFPGKIAWYDEQFARVESDKPIELKLSVEWDGGRRLRVVSVPVPKYIGLWNVGILPEEKLNFRIALGRPGEYTLSDPVSAVR